MADPTDPTPFIDELHFAESLDAALESARAPQGSPSEASSAPPPTRAQDYVSAFDPDPQPAPGADAEAPDNAKLDAAQSRGAEPTTNTSTEPRPPEFRDQVAAALTESPKASETNPNNIAAQQGAQPEVG
jgi:hypothetical protein